MGAAADDVVSAVVAAIATALRAPGAAVFVASGDNERTVPDAADVVLACHGELSGVPTRLPLRYAGADLGVLAVAPRPGETALGRADVRLLETLAPLVAAVVHAERLTGDLRLARARLLTATAAERSRLQHELHDGLGPALTGVGLGLALSRGLMEAMDGTLTPDDTPGGGLTMIVTLPVLPADIADPALTSRVDSLRGRQNR